RHTRLQGDWSSDVCSSDLEAGLEAEVDVVVGTLGKALGAYGAFAACSSRMARFLTNAARPFIFSTAPPPRAVAGALAALELLIEIGRASCRGRVSVWGVGG